MSTYTRKATIRYVEYRDEFLLKDPKRKVYVPKRFMTIALKQDGYLNFYSDTGEGLKYFFDEYCLDEKVIRGVVRKRPRIYVLAKREKGI